MLLPAAPALASGQRAGFLSHGPSVAAFGRGETGAAYPSDFSSFHYNPSLASSLRESNINFSHYALYDGSMYSFAGFCHPVKDYSIGLSAVNLRSGDVEIRRNIYDTPFISRANQWEYALTLAKRIERLFGIDCGVNLKYVYYDMYKYKGGSVGADLGISREMSGPVLFSNKTKLNAGFAAINIVKPSIKLDAERETLNGIYRLGAALSMPAVYRFLSADTLVVLTDIYLEDELARVLGGLEYRLMDRYVFRTGYYDGHVTSGAGYRDRAIRVDYAIDFSDFSLIHRLGISYFWAKPEKARKVTASSRSSLMKEAKIALKERNKQLAEERGKVYALFKEAKKDYTKKHYLRATDTFREILLKYPENANVKELYTNIVTEMNDTAKSYMSDDPENLSYAKGYVSYYGRDLAEALNEWEKVLQINPERTELLAYRTNVKKYLDDEKKRKKERDAESFAEKTFEIGLSFFNSGNWVQCIRIMEKVQEICRGEAFPRALECIEKSRKYIDLSVKELARSVNNERSASADAKVAVEIDVEGAERKYNEGLIMYAQGKIPDAVNLWEISVRLDPGNDKARKALKKAREELELRKRL